MEYCECLPTLLNPLAERTRFSQSEERRQHIAAVARERRQQELEKRRARAKADMLEAAFDGRGGAAPCIPQPSSRRPAHRTGYSPCGAYGAGAGVSAPPPRRRLAILDDLALKVRVVVGRMKVEFTGLTQNSQVDPAV